MNVLFCTNLPAPYRVDFFNLLGQRVNLTVTFSETPKGQTEETEKRDLRWFHEDYDNFRVVFLKGCSPFGKCAALLPVLRERYDHVILGGYTSPTATFTAAYLRLHKRPFLIELDGGYTDNSVFREESALHYRIKKAVMTAASGYLGSGEASQKFFAHYGANPELIYRYPFTGLRKADLLEERARESICRTEQVAIRKKLGMPEKYIVLYVGQFITRKGVDALLKAAPSLPPETGVYIVGGEPPKEYAEIVKELSLRNAHFVGFKSKEELRDFYHAADVFVSPTRQDFWGLTINEALSYGIPVVSTSKCTAAVELLKNGQNGYVVPANNSMALAEAIRKVLEGDVALFRRNALESISGYTLENMVSRHMEILEDIARKNAGTNG